MPELHVSSGVIPCSISDHDIIYTILNHSYKTKTQPGVITIRDFKTFYSLIYNKDLMDCNLYDSVNNCGNINDAWNTWSCTVNNIMKKHAPLKTYRVKSRSSPWITRDIISLMYRRDYIHGKAKKIKNDELFEQYKILRNKVVDQIRKANQNYFSGEICNNTNLKKMWRAISSLLNTRKMATSHDISPETFNTFFTNIGSDLTKTFTADVKLHWSLPESKHRFKFQQISEDEVLNNLNKLSHKSKQDVLGYDSLASSITNLFNYSLHTHQLPADWKKARVTPIYKGTGEVNEPNNYRPISVVSHISKMFEKCINHQLLQYFGSDSFLRHDQSSFRKGHSTGTALHKLVDDLLDNINEGMMNAICFFYLKILF